MKHQPIPEGYRAVKDALPVALVRAREAVLSHFRPMISELGFTEQQWRILRAVNEYEPIDISTLAESSALHMPSCTRIIQTLETNGFVYRVRDEKDSRRSWIHVTQKARDVMYDEGHRFKVLRDELRDYMGEDDMDTLSHLLEKIANFKREA